MSDSIICRMCGNRKPRYRHLTSCRDCYLAHRRATRPRGTEDPIKLKARIARYRHKHAAKVRIADVLRMARNRTDGEIPKGWFESQIATQRNRCNACLATFDNANNPTIDHILPVAQGGDNRVSNLQLLCGRCNRSKGSRSWSEWILEKHGRLL